MRVLRCSDALLVATGDVAMGAETVDVLGFNYGPASGILEPNTEYFILSKEHAGGDLWLDYDTLVIPTEDATVDGCVWSSDLVAFNVGAAPGLCYGPVNIVYDITLDQGEPGDGVRVPALGWHGLMFAILATVIAGVLRLRIPASRVPCRLTFQEKESRNR